jgi:hypothetical protein
LVIQTLFIFFLFFFFFCSTLSDIRF